MDNEKITFKKRPIPLPAEYRPMYQIAIIAMVLYHCSRAYTASLQKLHLFSWALYSDENMKSLKCILDRNSLPMIHWAIDPAVNRALGLAIADEICVLTSAKKYKLLPKGVNLINKIEKDTNLFQNEKNNLKQIGKRITDEIVDDLTIKKQ